ncbi:MAG: NAD(P)/FAD-dependent oxidoreductase [Methylobacterium sp.]
MTNAAAGSPPDTDVVVLGAGIAGVSAAACLARQGIRVTLVASHDHHPAEFRAEKTGERQMQLLDRFGLGAAARAHATVIDGVWLHRFGRIVERSTKREYGADYAELIDALRAALPAAVRVVIGQTVTVETGPDRQVVVLRDGRTFHARLLIVATGLGESVRRRLGIERDVYSPAHTLAAGFNLTRPPDSFPFPSLVWSGERFGDRVSYLTLFPIGGTMRANFYVYRTQKEPWTHAFRTAPEAELRRLMPRLEDMFGEIRLGNAVVTRTIDLMRMNGYARDGVVLVGDAFCTVCPITGTGIDKALTDVDRLCNTHVPDWLTSPGMTKDKIAAFYADPVKRARDHSAIKQSVEAREIKTELSVRWKLRRLKSNTLVRAAYRVRSVWNASPMRTKPSEVTR